MRSGGSPGTRGGAQAAQQKEMHEAALATADTVNAAPPHPLLMDTPGGVPQEVVDDNKLKKDLVAARSELEALRAEMARMGADPVNRRAAAPVGNVGGAAPGGSGVGGPSMPTRTYSDVDVVIMYGAWATPAPATAARAVSRCLLCAMLFQPTERSLCTHRRESTREGRQSGTPVIVTTRSCGLPSAQVRSGPATPPSRASCSPNARCVQSSATCRGRRAARSSCTRTRRPCG